MALFLKQNCYTTKSGESANKILSKIPEQLQHYFFLGLLDGDGCIRIDTKRQSYHVEICSVYEQNWDFMISLMDKLQIKYIIRKCKDKKGHKCSRFFIGGQVNVTKFLTYLYSEFNKNYIGLARKEHKFVELKERMKKTRFKGICFRPSKQKWEAYSPIINSDITTRIWLGFYKEKSVAEKVVRCWLAKNMPEKFNNEYLSIE